MNTRRRLVLAVVSILMIAQLSDAQKRNGADKVLIILLRQDRLEPNQLQALQAKLPGKQLVFKRTDPRDYKEHAATCDSLKPAAVILPLERPVPSLAMEKGFVHLAFTDKGVQRLVALKPEFEPFKPK